MDDKTLLNIVYDLIAQNPIKGAYGMMGAELDNLTAQVEEVDLDNMCIRFNNPTTGRHFRLQFTADFAPAPKAADV
jgi:gentisate 1,2-dioxygenase